MENDATSGNFAYLALQKYKRKGGSGDKAHQIIIVMCARICNMARILVELHVAATQKASNAPEIEAICLSGHYRGVPLYTPLERLDILTC